MSTVQKIAKNTFLLVTANIISLALGFFINIYIANYLKAGNFGIISAALNLATLFTVITDFGMSKYLTMELARRPGQVGSYLNNALSIKLGLVAIAYMGITASAYLGNFGGDKLLVVYIIGMYVMLTAITQIFQATFQAFQKMEHIAISQLINPVILLIGVLYVIATGQGVVAFALIYLTSGIIILAYNLLITLLYYTRPLPQFHVSMWRQLVLSGIPFSLSGLFYFIYYKIDIQLIDFMMGSNAVGYYSAAYKLIEAVICIPAMYAMAVFPLISSYFHNSDQNLKVLIKKSIKYLYLLGLPIVVGAFLLADRFIFLCYKDNYLASIDVLRVLSLGLLMIFINVIPGDVLIGTNMQRASIFINIIAAAVNIGLNLLVIPVYGIVGSAYTMVATQLVLLSLNYYMLKKAGYEYANAMEMLKITVCALLMGAFIYLTGGMNLNLALVVVVSEAIYFILIVVSRTLSKDDIAMIMQIFSWIPHGPLKQDS